LKGLSRAFAVFFASKQDAGPAMFKGIFVSKMLILSKRSLGENLGPAENYERVFIRARFSPEKLQ